MCSVDGVLLTLLTLLLLSLLVVLLLLCACGNKSSVNFVVVVGCR